MDLVRLCRCLFFFWDINLNGGFDFIYGKKKKINEFYNCLKVRKRRNFCFVRGIEGFSYISLGVVLVDV